ncbi:MULTISPECIES: MFS transporter [Streptosporangium]|uniref:MFS family permease n=1 Tax=Streptosporangium brasiliense TaxID=47480 RepID=A0ABT9RH79_9ACTN|nr:MFS transporter [Streptosporangium brasiliense]MDP9868084.1 MFS family permease [Streptosporangium brasiliense]
MSLSATTLRSLQHHNYRLWAGADLVSVSGTWMQVLGVNWLILSATGSATSVGLSLVLQALPTLLLGLWGGALADRFPTRRVVLATQVAHAFLAVALALVAISGPTSMTPVYGLVLAGGVVSAIGGPALGKFGAEVVPPEDLPNALALGSVVNSAGRILGMSLAGMLLPLTGTGALFLLNAVSFSAVIASVLAMRASEMHRSVCAQADTGGVRTGLAYVLRTPRLLVLLALALVLGGLGRNYQVTMAAMSAGPLDAGAGGYGLLSTVFAVGAVVGGVIAAGRPRLTIGLLLGTALLTSVAQSVSGFMPGVMTFAALILPIAAGAVIIDTTLGARVQLGSPGHMRGRVIAVQGVVSAAAGAIGGPLLGWLCDGFGPRLTLELAGAVTVAATLTAAAVLARLSNLRLTRAVILPAQGLLRRVPAEQVSALR